MTQEEKELLLKDLCGRLFYRIICKDQYSEYIDVNIYNAHIEHLVDQIASGVIKMVLRPMSSMTENENKEAKENGCIIYWDTSLEDKGLIVFASPKGLDWLNKKMFDYRGLIPMGLAIEAPKSMY